jgi:NADH dehydrogenase
VVRNERVLVVGGSGFVGRHLARELVGRGHRVTVLSRDPHPRQLPAGVETARGDVTDFASIEHAFDRMDAVVYLVALSPLFRPKGGEEMHERVHLGGARNVVAAAEGAGARRLLHMSALGADSAGATHYLRAKGKAEEVTRASRLAWTIFRPSVVFGEGGEFVSSVRMLAPPYLTPLPGGGAIRFQPIWVGDLVPILADALADDRHLGRTYELGGPQVLSLADVARLAHGARGRPVRVVPVPMALAGVGLTLAGLVPGLPMGPDQFRSLGADNVTADNAIEAFGRRAGELTTLETFLRRPSAGD